MNYKKLDTHFFFLSAPLCYLSLFSEKGEEESQDAGQKEGEKVFLWSGRKLIQLGEVEDTERKVFQCRTPPPPLHSSSFDRRRDVGAKQFLL